MNAAARPLLALVLSIAPQTAFAHPPFAGVGGFSGGLLHPLFVPAHAMAIMALGLLFAQQPRRLLGTLAFIFGLAAGSFAIAMAYVPSYAADAVLGLAVVTGGLIALAKPLPALVVGVLATAIGLAITLDSPPEAISINEAIRIQLGTVLAASIYLIAIAAVASPLKREWQRIAMRILGSWIVASALLVLASRLVR